MKFTNSHKKSMTKKKWREQCQRQRVQVNFNTGTRTHKSAKDYVRKWSPSDYER